MTYESELNFIGVGINKFNETFETTMARTLGCNPDHNLCDEIGHVATALHAVGRAITPAGAGGSNDAAGAYVASLTEALMGITAGLVKIAEAIEYHADRQASRNARPDK